MRLSGIINNQIKLKKMLLGFSGIVYGVMLTGCGGADMEVSIHDGQVETRLQTQSGMSVSQILEEAEIVLDDEDEVSPGKNEIVNGSDNSIEIKRHAKVEITVEDGDPTLIDMMGGTVGEALAEAGVEIEEHDYINHDMNAYLTDGMEINVTRRLVVTLEADGNKREVLTQAKTVDELLDEQGLILGDIDRITPKIGDQLKEGTKVTIKRVEKKEVVENEPIEFETVTTYSNSMTVGTSKILKEGVNDEKKVTYEVTYVDGKEESRVAMKEDVIKEAIAQEVVLGSKPKGKQVVSKEAVYDCDGSGHGFYIITYSDGSVEYKDF